MIIPLTRRCSERSEESAADAALARLMSESGVGPVAASVTPRYSKVAACSIGFTLRWKPRSTGSPSRASDALFPSATVKVCFVSVSHREHAPRALFAFKSVRSWSSRSSANPALGSGSPSARWPLRASSIILKSRSAIMLNNVGNSGSPAASPRRWSPGVSGDRLGYKTKILGAPWR